MQQTHRQTGFLVLGFFLLGACMRAPFTSLPSVVNEIAASFHVPATSLGILTTIPLLCFGLLSSIVPAVSRRIGNEAAIAIALVILALGSVARVLSLTTLMLGTVLIGVATTFINVLLPAIITEKTPAKIGLMTSLFNVSLTMFSALGAYLITPIAQHSSWQTGVQVLTGLVILTALLWIPTLKGNRPAPTQAAGASQGHNMYRNRRAWYLLLYFGLSSFVFYTTVAWLPSIAMDHGLSTNQASLVAGLFQLFSMPTAFVVPLLATKVKKRGAIVAVAGGLTLLGYVGLLLPIGNLAYYTGLALLLGLGTASTFGLIMTLFGLKTSNPADTSALSGMVQSLGYLLAAIGPWLTGNLKAATGNWQLALLVTIVITLVFTGFGLLSERHDQIIEK